MFKVIQEDFCKVIEEKYVENCVIYNDVFYLEIGRMVYNDYFMLSLCCLLIDYVWLGKIFYCYLIIDDM